jgi:hypothetical protein
MQLGRDKSGNDRLGEVAPGQVWLGLVSIVYDTLGHGVQVRIG